MRKRLCYLTLIGLIVIGCTACSGSGTGNSPGSTGVEKAASVVKKNPKADSTVIAIGKEKVTYAEVLTYLYWLKSDYETKLGSGVWNCKVDKSTVSNLSMEETIHLITELKVLCKKAKSIGVELSFDEKDSISQKAEASFAQIDSKDVEKFHLDVKLMEEIYCENEIANKMFDVCLNGVDTDISDEDAKQVSIQYLLVMTKGTNRNSMEVNADDTEKQQLLKKTEDLLVKAKELQKSNFKDMDFLTFAQNNTDLSETEATIGRKDREEAFASTAFSLKKGELSPVIETSEGYAILYCTNDNNQEAIAAVKEEIILQAQTEIFEQQYKEWAKEYEVKISDSLWKANILND